MDVQGPSRDFHSKFGAIAEPRPVAVRTAEAHLLQAVANQVQLELSADERAAAVVDFSTASDLLRYPRPAVTPPSTGKTAPVIQPASSPAR